MGGAVPTLPRFALAAPEGAPLERFLPETPVDGLDQALQRRAALASTLLAGLELGREGAASLSQEGAFAAIVVAPAGPVKTAHCGRAQLEEADRAGRLRADPAEG